MNLISSFFIFQSQGAHQKIKAFAQTEKVGVKGARAAHDNDIKAGEIIALTQPVRFLYTPADPISPHRVAELCADRDAEPVHRQAVFAAVDDEIRAGF